MSFTVSPVSLSLLHSAQMHLQDDNDDDVESRHLLLFEEGDRKLKALADDDQLQRGLSRWDIWIFLLSAMCGSGILVQPFVFMQSGIILTAIMYVIVASIVWLSVHILLQCAQKLEVYTYADLCKAVLGQPGKYVADLTFIFCYFCALLSYFVAIGTMAANVMITVITPVNESGNINWLSRPTFNTIMLVLIFITPMTLIRLPRSTSIESFPSGSLVLLVDLRCTQVRTSSPWDKACFSRSSFCRLHSVGDNVE